MWIIYHKIQCVETSPAYLRKHHYRNFFLLTFQSNHRFYLEQRYITYYSQLLIINSKHLKKIIFAGVDIPCSKAPPSNFAQTIFLVIGCG